MHVLFVVSHPNAAPPLLGLAGACVRAQVAFRCFFTGDGVQLLRQAGMADVIRQAERVVACEYSWERHFPGITAPVEQGSQTDHSAMIGEAERVISL